MAQANQSLPDYAWAHRWTRLEQPFTPDNGLLTVNGRPRRDAIAERYRMLLSTGEFSEDTAR
ncbi:hypothetical protein D9M73_279050 [compost metagenome]